MSLPSKAIILSDDGEAYQASFNRVGNAADVMKKTARSMVWKFPMLCKVPSGESINIGVQGTIHCVSAIIKQVCITSSWRHADGIAYPSFEGRRDGTGAIKSERIWRTPESMALHFSMFFDMRVGVGKMSISPIWPALVAVSKNNARPGFWRLPLANIHENGKVCLGSEVTVAPGDTLVSLWQKAFNIFQSSPYNEDLAGEQSQEETKQVFGWRGDEQVINEDWESFCQNINHSYYDTICI